MPTYEFRCPAGHDFEKFFRKISDSTGELPCPECGAVAHRRVSAGAGLLFKGSGFYITDYGKDGKGARKAAESASDAGGGEKPKSGETTGSDAKPASSTERSKGERPSASDSSAGSPGSGSSSRTPDSGSSSGTGSSTKGSSTGGKSGSSGSSGDSTA